jgi:hypothetical protein
MNKKSANRINDGDLKNILKDIFHFQVLRKNLAALMLGFALILTSYKSHSQCGTGTTLGQNLVQNGDFSLGDTLFTSPYGSWNNPNDGATPCGNVNPMTCPRNWSSFGEYWVHPIANDFNPGAFSSVPSTGSGGNMMLVDAMCTPGQTVWQQTVTVTANTNHYFSVRIASIHPTAPAQLAFQVNGLTLGTLVNAPATVNTWLFYEASWNSGVLSGPVTLKIIEQSGVGCANGDDFAIDDIQFIPGCQYGVAGPVPNLGPDKTICGTGGSITLDSNVPHTGSTTVTWSDGTTGFGMGAPYTKNISAAGTYSVCVSDGGSCTKSDVIVISNTYSINLGPDRNLCNPPTLSLDAGYSGPGVTYLWTLNGSPLPGATNKLYTANQVGTYSVQVTDPVCGAREDQLVITSSTVTANNGQFCTTPSTVNLSINGAGGTYNWYSAASGGTLLQTNSTTYTTPAISATTTYYVEDASSFSYVVGPTSNLSGWGRSDNLSNHYLRFNALSSFVLDYVTIYAYNGWNANINVQVVLANSSGTVLATSTPVTVSGSVNTTMHRIPVGITVPVGTDLRMYAISTGGQIAYDGNSHPTTNWPYQVAGVVSIHTNVDDGNPVQNSYNHLYKWEISSGAICSRVPVIATQFCPASCNPPAAYAISNASPVVMCTGGNVILNASSNPGYTYSWIRNGVVVAGPTVDLSNYTTNQTGTYSVRITETGNPFCFRQSASVDVVEFNIGAVNLPPDYNTCSPTQTLDAIVSGTGVTYIWERNAAVIPGATSRTYTISDLGAYRVWVNHPICGMATDVVVVGAGTYSINLGSDRNLCTPTSYTLDAGFTAAGVTYQWQSPIGTNISGATNQTHFVNSPGTYRVNVTHPFCGNQSDDITITSSLGTPTNDNYCSDDPADKIAHLAISGAGPYAWYTTATGSVPPSVGSGNTYDTPNNIVGDVTYYVQSNASFKYNKGPLNVNSIIDPTNATYPTRRYIDMTNFNNMTNDPNQYIDFTALTNMTFDSVTVYPQWVGFTPSFTITLNVKNVTTNTNFPISYLVNPNPMNGGYHGANPNIPIKIPIGVALVAGNSYRITTTNTSGTAPQLVRFQPDTGPIISMASTIWDQAGVVDFTNAQDNGNCDCNYPGFFNFVFSAGVPCDRVPVVAYDLSPGCYNPLPVSWLDFTATPAKKDVILNWATATEKDNNNFSIERSSDGIHWEIIGMISGHGNSASVNRYSFIDTNPLQGQAYYRIAQNDYNGSRGYSPVRTVIMDLALAVNVVPNPFSGSTTITISNPFETPIDLELIDVSGRTLFIKKAYTGNHSLELGNDLASGLYLLKVITEGHFQTIKVIKN